MCNGLWPSKCASNVGVRAIYVQIRVVFTWLKLYFNVPALIFYVCEGLSQPIANQLNMQKIMVSIFLTVKATIFDTHGTNEFDLISTTYVESL